MMAQKRDLQPITVYLPPEVIGHYEKQAAQFHEAVSATLRRVIMQDHAVGRRLKKK